MEYMNLKRFCTIGLSVLLLAILPPTLAAGNGPIPEKFRAEIGGFTGPSYFVELKNGVLVYHTIERGMVTDPIQITPTINQWQAFRNSLDKIGVWKWQQRYMDPGVDDGTQWYLEVEYNNTKITTYGSNNYPDSVGGSMNIQRTKPFITYLRAVQELIGNKTFH